LSIIIEGKICLYLCTPDAYYRANWRRARWAPTGSRSTSVPLRPRHRYPQRATVDQRRYGVPARPLFRQSAAILARPAKPIRSSRRRAWTRRRDRKTRPPRRRSV